MRSPQPVQPSGLQARPTTVPQGVTVLPSVVSILPVTISISAPQPLSGIASHTYRIGFDTVLFRGKRRLLPAVRAQTPELS